MYVIRNRSGANYSRITYIIRTETERSEGAFRIMAIPAAVAAHFVLIESQSFGGLQILFDMKACANGLDDDGQGRLQGSVDQIIGASSPGSSRQRRITSQ